MIKGGFLGGLCALASAMGTLYVLADGCTALHCSQRGQDTAEVCRLNADLANVTLEQYAARGGKAVVIENGAYCTCPCSCVAGSVQIGTVNGYIPMETLTTHDILATPMSSKQSSALEAILASDVADEKVVGIQFSNGASIVSSPNHTFVSPDERVVEARTLLKGQKVKAASGALIEVVADPIEGRYDGRLYNVIVNENSLAPVDHIIDLEGVLSGDWQLQSSNDLVEEEIFLRTSTVRSFK